jgi:glutamyl-tRNA reductase
MSVVVVGLSHRTAPLALLERTALAGGASTPAVLLDRLAGAEFVDGAAVLSTCNRLEVYADVSRFHGGVSEVGAALSRTTGVRLPDLADHLYMHYDDAAARHAFRVACGLDSMAIGEAQILGQLRGALKLAQDGGWCGGRVGQLLQQALRVGKRAHAETRLDQAGGSLVSTGLDRAAELLGGLAGRSALVLGAGAMAGLVAGTLLKTGLGSIVVASRTSARAQRLADSAGGRYVPWSQLPQALAGADLVVATAGAAGTLVQLPQAAAARAERPAGPDGLQAYVDLALPRDVDPAVGALAGIELIDLETLGRLLAGHPVQADLDSVEAIVTEEVTGFLAAQRAAAVAPTVVALRERARSVVEAELLRLDSRLGPVDDRVRAEVTAAVHRVVDKLLHTPTVRIKQLAGEPGGDSYADALRALFDLDLEQLPAAGAIFPDDQQERP